VQQKIVMQVHNMKDAKAFTQQKVKGPTQHRKITPSEYETLALRHINYSIAI